MQPMAKNERMGNGAGEGANSAEAAGGRSLNFIEQIVEEDLRTGKHGGRVQTRFPPEPNGYLHIGHAKSICLNFGLAAEYNGLCNLRFDDTNPCKEEVEYVESIQEDVRWLGFDWGERLYYASDYFEQLYGWAVQLIRAGKAYVCDLSADEMRQYRGTLTEPGRNSPFRDRSMEENLDLFQRMRAGEFPDGSRTLRAKIDMAHPNLNMRDPVLYRILHAYHHRTGDQWCIYSMYDFAHGQSDSIERITHSICTLEFENHRPLYDWFIQTLGIYAPQQIEFARLNLSYTVMSKRKLLELVKQGHVSGWDDPRMPTICGLRRRGYTPESIRTFCDRIGVAKFNSTIDVSVLENCVREHLNAVAPRAMAILRPLRVVIEDYPEGRVEQLEAVNNPEDASAGTREDSFLPRRLHRARRFSRGSSQAVPPARSRARSSPALCVRHQMRTSGQERARGNHRTPLHPRSRNARQATRRPSGQRRHPLGLGPTRRAGRGASVRSPVYQVRSGGRSRKARTTKGT